MSKDQEEPIDNLITWVFEEGTFRPAAKIMKDKAYSILTDYLGTPKEAYDWWANKVWAIELEAYGKVKSYQGWLGTPADESFIPFRFQGQYHDLETGLYYNRYRYYSPEEGMYVTAQDPIRLYSNTLNLYNYIHDPNAWIDPLGLAGLRSLAEQIADSGEHFLSQKLRTVAVGRNAQGQLFAASSNGLDAGQRAKALELGITPLNSSTVFVDGKNLHAEEVLLKEVDDLAAVGTWKRAPCGPDEHNCLQQLIDRNIKIECH